MRIRPLAAFAAFFPCLAAFHLWTLKSFPRLILDEAVESNHSYNLLTRGENVYSLFEEIFPPEFASMRHPLPNVLRPYYNLALAAALRVGGVSPWTARALSLLCSLASLALLSWLCWRWTASWGAALAAAALLGVNLLFTFSAHQTRPEALLGLAGVIAFACIEEGRKRPWLLVPAGAAAAGACTIHTNGGGLALAAAAVLALRAPRGWLHFLLGLALGGVPALFLVHPERFMPSWVVFGGFFSYRPPLEAWGANLAGAFAAETTKFLAPAFFGPELLIPGVPWSLRLEGSLIFSAWLAAWFFLEDARERALLAWIGIWELFFTCFVAIKGANYASPLEPFFILLFVLLFRRLSGVFLSRWSPRKSALAGLGGAALLCHGSLFLLTPVLFSLLLLRRERQTLHLFILFALMPLGCLRLFMPEVFAALLHAALYHLRSPLEDLAAAASLIGLALWLKRSKEGTSGILGGWLAAGLAASLAVNASFQTWAIASRSGEARAFDEILVRARGLVPPGAKVLGPQQLWFAFWDQPYQDWDGLAYAKWLTGRTDLTRYLTPWRPDYLITDCRFGDTFLRRRRLEQVLRVPLRKVGTVDVGGTHCDPFEVYRFVWR